MTDQAQVPVGDPIGLIECDNGDGQRVRFIVIDVDTRERPDMLCAACYLALVTAAIATLADQADNLPPGQQG